MLGCRSHLECLTDMGEWVLGCRNVWERVSLGVSSERCDRRWQTWLQHFENMGLSFQPSPMYEKKAYQWRGFHFFLIFNTDCFEAISLAQ